MSEQSYSKKYAIDKARVLNFLGSLKGIDEIKVSDSGIGDKLFI